MSDSFRSGIFNLGSFSGSQAREDPMVNKRSWIFLEYLFTMFVADQVLA